METFPTVGAVIVAAGASRRMVGVDKLWATVRGQPLLAHTIAVFARSPHIGVIVLVVAADRLDDACALLAAQSLGKPHVVVVGGARRRDSVLRGLAALPEDCAIALIHDGARPLVTEALILMGLRAVAATGAATAVIPVKDTIKRVDAAGLVVETPDRAALYAVQTPQVFDRVLILAAHHAADPALDAADDALLVESLGHRVRVFTGAYTNIKVTTPDDLAVVEALWPTEA
ncbi:MAG: 2-C-methyl-D-erythritol 4-phosphate cytidylyltransferase [Ktedonobacterales bacterium]|nr:2-C-methyl-D-erythritol 4-phosphate cytidylyltransferase [Ktedonobacterales bacterium]